MIGRDHILDNLDTKLMLNGDINNGYNNGKR